MSSHKFNSFYGDPPEELHDFSEDPTSSGTELRISLERHARLTHFLPLASILWLVVWRRSACVSSSYRATPDYQVFTPGKRTCSLLTQQFLFYRRSVLGNRTKRKFAFFFLLRAALISSLCFIVFPLGTSLESLNLLMCPHPGPPTGSC